MKHKRLIIATTVFFLVVNTCFALGIGEWSAETPYGNRIKHDRYTEITTFYGNSGEPQLDSLDKWYFYSNHTIGSTSSEKYFVIDEKSLSINIFTEKEEWNDYIIRGHLKPAVWTRWYYTDWTFATDELIVILFVELFIGALLTGVLAFLKGLKKSVLKQATNRKPFIVKSLLICVALPAIMTIISYILSLHPASF